MRSRPSNCDTHAADIPATTIAANPSDPARRRRLRAAFSLAAVTGTLVILRHGESTWNQQNLSTGWHERAALSERGRAEAPAAGRTMAEAGVRFDVAHTSVLARAVVTCHLALEAMGQVWLPVQRNWRLNERHYGALQGLDKKQTAEPDGAEQEPSCGGAATTFRRRPSTSRVPSTRSTTFGIGCCHRTSSRRASASPTSCQEHVLPYWHRAPDRAATPRRTGHAASPRTATRYGRW